MFTFLKTKTVSYSHKSNNLETNFFIRQHYYGYEMTTYMCYVLTILVTKMLVLAFDKNLSFILRKYVSISFIIHQGRFFFTLDFCIAVCLKGTFLFWFWYIYSFFSAISIYWIILLWPLYFLCLVCIKKIICGVYFLS